MPRVSTAKKGVPGRPPYEPSAADRELVRDMVVVGVDQARIAAVLKIDPVTLRKHFRDELDLGMDHACAKVGRNLMALTETHPLAAIYFLNNRMPGQWRDRRNIEAPEVPAQAPSGGQHLHVHFDAASPEVKSLASAALKAIGSKAEAEK